MSKTITTLALLGTLALTLPVQAADKATEAVAEKAAEKVRTTKIPFTFDPMNSNERRILHLALSEDASVRTESTGNGENRKLTIYPA